MTEKTTRKELFTRIAETMADDYEVVEMCNKYIVQLSSRKKKVNKESQEFDSALATFMSEANAPMRMSELADAMNVAWQKVNASLKRLVDAEVVMGIDGEGSEKPTFVIA